MHKQASTRPFQVNLAFSHLSASLSKHFLCRVNILFRPFEVFRLPETPSFSEPQHKASERKAGNRVRVSYLLPTGAKQPEEDFQLGAVGSPAWQIHGKGDAGSAGVPPASLLRSSTPQCQKRPDIPSRSPRLLLVLRDGIKPVQIRR